MFPAVYVYFLPTLKLLLITTMVTTGCSGGGNSSAPATAQATGTPGAEEAVGERLFMETRFARRSRRFWTPEATSTIRAQVTLSWIQWKPWEPP